MNVTVLAGTLLDGTGGPARGEIAIEIGDNRITNVSPWGAAEGIHGNRIDARGLTVLPGLIDCHVHLGLDATGTVAEDEPWSDQRLRIATANAQSLLDAGVTTAADCGGARQITYAVRDAIAAGAIPGPRILAAGEPIAPPQGHGEGMSMAVRGEEAIRVAVRDLAASGADLIKVMATEGGGESPSDVHYSGDELTSLVETAHAAGLRVAAHCHGVAGIRNAIAARVDRLEHCTFVGNDGSEFDPAVAEAIATSGTVVCPTNPIDFRRIQAGGEGAPRDLLNANWRSLLAAGVSFATGTDAGVKDVHFHDYALAIELMVAELDMSAGAAIEASTRVAAEALGIDDEVGTVAPGKLADLVAVRGNPLADPSALRDIAWVMRAGTLVSGPHDPHGVPDGHCSSRPHAYQPRASE